MSRDWTEEELAAASEAMEKMGYPGYEEFCKDLRQMETDRKNADPDTQKKGGILHEYNGKD